VLKILSYVQHLYGVGHVFRAKRVAEALSARGHAVDLVLGGFEVPGLRVDGPTRHQLTPIRTVDGTYQHLVTREDRPIDDALMDERRDALLALYDTARPDVLVLEGFPLARRKFRFELIPLLERAKASDPRPLVVVSARDVLQRPARAKRIDEALQTFADFCDALLVHGDAAGSAMTESFPELAKLQGQTHFTGLVGPVQTRASGSGSDADVTGVDVVVSAGGGAVGETLLRAAIQGKPLSRMARARWLVLAGPNLSDGAFAELGDLAATHDVRLERFHPDLRGVMQNAALSISQAGYNTVADVLTTACRAVFVPFAEHGQNEQPARAHALQAIGRAMVVDEAGLTPERLARAIDAALALPEPIPRAFDGAVESAKIVERLASDRPASNKHQTSITDDLHQRRLGPTD